MTIIHQTSSRKLDHIRICSQEQVEQGDPGFQGVHLVHNALPECDMAGIHTGVRFLGHQFGSPLFIAAMTGGHPETVVINQRLAQAAERFNLGMGVGSQRAALENPDLEGTFAVVRDMAPSAFICANIGIVQLRDHGIEWADRAVEMIRADALAVHLNFLQEAIQPEGDHNARGCLAALSSLCEEVSYPVIVKETGSGIAGETARQIAGAGAAAIDIGGWGGTSWAAIEAIRADESSRDQDRHLVSLGEEFLSWGIPTVTSLCEVVPAGLPVIATGGVRTGIDMAKAVALGADLAGMALPLLNPALKGEGPLNTAIERLLHQLKVTMFLTGSPDIAALKRTRVIISGTNGALGAH